jgi:hypothetical protein
VGLGFLLSFRIFGRGITAPDAFIPLANLVFGPIFQILVSNITWFLGNTMCWHIIINAKMDKRDGSHGLSVIYVPSDWVNYLDIQNMKQRIEKIPPVRPSI